MSELFQQREHRDSHNQPSPEVPLALEELGAHISILWAPCIYTVRMRLHFGNQKANILNLETILG